MGAKYAEHGGEAVQGLSSDYISSLQSLLNGGGMGAAGSPDAMGSTGNIMSVLQDILSGGKGKAGSAISQLLSTQQTRDTNAIRARFGASGGTAFGTPAAYAESNYRAQAAPQITQAITGLQLGALGPLLQHIAELSGRGITQRQGQMEKSGFAQGLGVLTQVAGAAAPFFGAGGFGGGGGVPDAPKFLSPTDQMGQINSAPSFMNGIPSEALPSLAGYFG